jgi:hypothetical protein
MARVAFSRWVPVALLVSACAGAPPANTAHECPCRAAKPSRPAVVAKAPPTRPAKSALAGWYLTGPAKDDYELVRDASEHATGAASARLGSIAVEPKGFGAIGQTVKADAFRGKRVRFTAMVKAKELGDWAGLWMRVDRPDQRGSGFDNMHDRPIRGSSDWKRYEVVLDVADDASRLTFGMLVLGKGTAWLDGVEIEIVDESVGVTGGVGSQPRNLGFEE